MNGKPRPAVGVAISILLGQSSPLLSAAAAAAVLLLRWLGMRMVFCD